jgi:hypothetical protein
MSEGEGARSNRMESKESLQRRDRVPIFLLEFFVYFCQLMSEGERERRNLFRIRKLEELDSS